MLVSPAGVSIQFVRGCADTDATLYLTRSVMAGKLDTATGNYNCRIAVRQNAWTIPPFTIVFRTVSVIRQETFDISLLNFAQT